MSSARGNLNKSGPPKYQNKRAFKNDLHDKSLKTKRINAIEVVGACRRCTDAIEWKIKYKKYKPLTVPKKCTLCAQKTVRRAYYILCDACQKTTQKCGRCGKQEEVLKEPGPSAAEETRQRVEFERDLGMLTERQRRTFFRLQAQGKLTAESSPLAVRDMDDDQVSDGSDFDDDEPDSDT